MVKHFASLWIQVIGIEIAIVGDCIPIFVEHSLEDADRHGWRMGKQLAELLIAAIGNEWDVTTTMQVQATEPADDVLSKADDACYHGGNDSAYQAAKSR